MRGIIGRICLMAGIIMVLAAALILTEGRVEDYHAQNAAGEILPALQKQISHPKTPEVPATVTLDLYDYMGYISLPTLGLTLPVMADCDYTRLKTAPCRYYGDIQSGDLVIAGHNYQSHFGRIKNLKEGDLIYFTDTGGTVFSYRVCLMEILNSDQVDEMLQGDWNLTLYTCTVSGQSRVTVRCRQED